MKFTQLLCVCGATSVIATFGTPVMAETVIPQSALTPSTSYYTDSIGGGLGPVAVMTGGGHTPGIGDPSGRNDDGFSGPINLGFTFNFFGTNYSTFFANNNGNISFQAGISEYVPTGPVGATSPVISPWFDDVDTTASHSGVMHVRTDIANELIVTWDNVGYFDHHDDKLNSFQLVVRGPGFATPAGEGAIGFFYKDMPWESTDTSTVAAVGFGDGSGHGEVLSGSTHAGLNSAVANHHIWFDQSLVPVPVPEPKTYALLLAGLGVLGLLARLSPTSINRRVRSRHEQATTGPTGTMA